MKTLLLLAFLAAPAHAATTTVYSTTTYGGVASSAIAAVSPAALPSVGAYYFNLVVVSSSTAFSGLSLYIQQQGIAGGQYYTVANSTFTTCNAGCTEFVVPDVYLGGNVRPQWSITTGSATVTVTAIPAAP